MAISSCLKLCSQGASSNTFSSWSLQSLHECVSLKVVDRAPLLLGSVLQGRTTQLNPLSLCAGFSTLHNQGGGGLALPSDSPQAGLTARPPFYPQVTCGWDPAALCPAFPGLGRGPCGLGPMCLLPRSQVKALCPRHAQGVGWGWAVLQQLPRGPLPGLFVHNLLPVRLVGSDGQLWFLGPCLT